jgi:hypothetical protein
MKKNKKATILVYAIILTSITLIIANIVLKNYESLKTNWESIKYENLLSQNIVNKTNYISKLEQKLNSN